MVDTNSGPSEVLMIATWKLGEKLSKGSFCSSLGLPTPEAWDCIRNSQVLFIALFSIMGEDLMILKITCKIPGIFQTLLMY